MRHVVHGLCYLFGHRSTQQVTNQGIDLAIHKWTRLKVRYRHPEVRAK